MAKDIHASRFAASTKHKLWLYEQYLQDALPVFLMHPHVKDINLFDFFAGPGVNVDGEAGSPAIALDVMKRTLITVGASGKNIHLFFNEMDKKKYAELSLFVQEMKTDLPPLDIHVENKDFRDVFPSCKKLMSSPNAANLVFIDQYGISHVTRDVFEFLARLQFTDFMFFLASGSANRFKDDDKAIWSHLPPLSDEEKVSINSKNVHRILASSYRRWIPPGCDCYLGNFSFQRQANVYGLVFGSGHPLGLDKFLRKAWKLAADYGGQADYDIDDDGISTNQMEMFDEYAKPTKLRAFELELTNKFKSHSFIDNVGIYLFSLEFGVLPVHARQAIKVLIAKKVIPKQTIHISDGCLKKSQMIQY